jgi:membrane-bound acyltransferase YfiQ involved in biofilm formation
MEGSMKENRLIFMNIVCLLFVVFEKVLLSLYLDMKAIEPFIPHNEFVARFGLIENLPVVITISVCLTNIVYLRGINAKK